jgi:hypothetical protein
LRPQAWDAGSAHACVERIVAGPEAAYVSGQGWPAHPLDCAETAAALRRIDFGDLRRAAGAALPAGTGDPGFALCLLDCICETDRFPTLD